jgi:hypothetical protein
MLSMKDSDFLKRFQTAGCNHLNLKEIICVVLLGQKLPEKWLVGLKLKHKTNRRICAARHSLTVGKSNALYLTDLVWY